MGELTVDARDVVVCLDRLRGTANVSLDCCRPFVKVVDVCHSTTFSSVLSEEVPVRPLVFKCATSPAEYLDLEDVMVAPEVVACVAPRDVSCVLDKGKVGGSVPLRGGEAQPHRLFGVRN